MRADLLSLWPSGAAVTPAELEAHLTPATSLRASVVASAEAILERSAFSPERRASARARFEAWTGEAPAIDSSALVRELLDWEAEREIIRRALTAGHPRGAMAELEAVDPVRDAWVSALGDLAFATVFEATGNRWMAVRKVHDAIERAAFTESGVPFGAMDDPRYLAAFAVLARASASR